MVHLLQSTQTLSEPDSRRLRDVLQGWEEITIPTYATHARYGIKAGQPNPRFLDAQAFIELVLHPYRDAHFQPHAGPFLFEFQRHGLRIGEFFFTSRCVLEALPNDFRYALRPAIQACSVSATPGS